MKFPKKNRKGIKKAVFRRGKYKPSVSTVKSIVNHSISRAIEQKHCMFNQTLNILPFSSGIQDQNVIPLSPYATYMSINQGVSDGSRTGNAINIKKASISFTLYPYPYDATYAPAPRPQEVMFIVFYDRYYDNTALCTPSANADFFQTSTGSTTFTGNLIDINRWVNLDRYKVFYKKVFKLGFSQYGGTGANAGAQSYSNNDYKYNCNFKFNYAKYLVKHCKYNDNTSIPSTRALSAMWISVPANGSTWGAGERPAIVQYQTHMTYTDA